LIESIQGIKFQLHGRVYNDGPSGIAERRKIGPAKGGNRPAANCDLLH
jgi:hypothetical protein